MSSEILMVCTGNICRSPVAQALLAHGLAGTDARVDSAGTHAVIGAPPAPESLDYISRRTGMGLHHVGTFLDRGIAERADLILTMTSAHRAAVVRTAPRAVRRSFTLREFATILQGLDPGASTDLEELVTLATRQRARARDTDLDIFDPIGGTPVQYEESFDLVAAAVDCTVPALRAVLGETRGGGDHV